MSAQILTTSNICVETIESIEDEFNITSSNSIIFETNNILIGDVSFSEFCSNIVFGVPLNNISHEDIFKVDAGTITNKDEITNMSEYELLSIDCTQITSDETYETGNKEHYINIQGKDKIYIRSENIFVKHHSYNESFHDYTYRMINKKSISESVGKYHFISRSFKTVLALSVSEKNDRIADVTNMGTYVTKKILCNAITTENIYNSQEDKEAQLKLKSNSAIRLNLNDIDENKNNIFIEDDVGGVRTNISLNQYINYRLDEYGLINIDLEAEPGVDITIYFNQNGLGHGFSNYYNYIPQFRTFQYKVNFKIVLNKGTHITTNIPSIANIGIYDSYHEPIIGPANDLDTNGIIYDTTGMIDGIFYDTTNPIKYPMSNLTAGNFYNIYADVTNNYTGITYYNILTSAVNVPTIEHVVIERIAVINEREIEIDFSPHVTVVPTWYGDPDKLVYFSVKLYNHNDSSILSNGTDFTYIDGLSQDIQLRYDIGRDKDIDVDIARTNRENTQLKYRFDVNTLTNYNNPLSDYDNYSDSVIKLDGLSSDSRRYTLEHTFSIVSNHITGNFEMISIPEFTMPTARFDNPNAPTNFSVQYPEETSYPPSRNNIFQWTRSTNTDSRITKLFYEIFKDTYTTPRLNKNDLEDDLINYYNLPSPKYTSHLNQEGVTDSSRILQNIGEISTNDTRNQVEGIIPGTYKIRAYNFFGQRSAFATYEVTQLTLTNVKLTPIEDVDKEWTILYQIENNNGNYLNNPSIYDDTSIIYYLENDEQNELVSEISFNTSLFQDFDILYTVNTLIQDTTMKIKSYDTTLMITRPTINISSGVYAADLGDRIFAFTIQIVTTSLNDQSIEILDSTGSSYQNIDSEISNSEIITVINNVTTNTNGNTNLDTSYATTYFINDKQSQITLKVTDLYLNDDTATFSFTPEISFELACKDKFGYQTDNTNISIDSNIIPVNFANIPVTTEYTGTARQFGLNSTLIDDNTFTGYQWQFDSSRSDIFTNIPYTNNTITRSDGSNLFGDYRCKITQKNHEGFQKKIYSSVFNNPFPTILNTGKSFEITSPTSYTFEYIGDDNVALNSSWNKNFTNIVKYENGNDQLIRISRDDNDQFIYKISGTYKLEVFVRNQYYFGKYFTIGTYDVTSPAAPSITFGSKTYKSITINYTLNANGTPNQDPQNIILNMNAVEIKKDLPPTSTSYTKDGLDHNTPYTFKIIKRYSDYDDVFTILSIRTYNKPTSPSITDYTQNLTSITVYFSLGSNSEDPNYQSIDPSSYDIIITSGSGFNGGPTAENLTSTSRTFTNLLPGRPFDFRLSKTYSNLDFGTYTVIGSSSTTDVVPATNPSITKSSSTITSITVNLSTNNNNNGSATSGVTYTLSNVFSNRSADTITSIYTIENLLPETDYNFTFTKIIGSPWKDEPYNMKNKSATLNTRTADLDRPIPPSIDSSSANGSTITLNYNLNSNRDYDTTTMTASLYYSTSNFSSGGGTFLSSLSGSSYTTSGLTQNQTYFFMIKKVVSSGYTSVPNAHISYSGTISKQTGYDTTRPENVTVTVSSTGPTINVTWEQGIGVADYYSINVDYGHELITNIPSSSRRIDNLDYSSLTYLTPGINYDVKVVKWKGTQAYYSIRAWFTP